MLSRCADGRSWVSGDRSRLELHTESQCMHHDCGLDSLAGGADADGPVLIGRGSAAAESLRPTAPILGDADLVDVGDARLSGRGAKV